MSESLAVGQAPARPAPADARATPAAKAAAANASARVGATPGTAVALDPRRGLQLALAGLWLLDGILQFQPSMFTTAFPRMLAGAAAGNPAAVASPVGWSAALITHHLAVLNAIFAATQLALGLGIAWRPTVRLALAGSVLWAAVVWFLGEGLGGVLAGVATPVDGAPGAVILYGLLALLLWPRAADREARFVAGRAVGARTAQALWLVLWVSLAFFALQPAARAPSALSDAIQGMAAGQPDWLGGLDTHTASLLAGQGLLASILLATVCVIVAVGPYLPAAAGKTTIVLALVLAAFLCLAQGFGGIFTGSGTDPNSGPLLALLALSFWPTAHQTRLKPPRGTES